MHTLNPDAHGLFAAAVLSGLMEKLISKDVLSKDEVIDICTAVKTTFDARGVRHDNAAETDAALLAASLVAEIKSRF